MFKIYTIILCLICTNLSAEVVQKLSVEGNSRIGKETIKVYGEITLGKDYTALDINKILKRLYETDFFEDIKINLNDGVLNIFVKEYSIINFSTRYQFNQKINMFLTGKNITDKSYIGSRLHSNPGQKEAALSSGIIIGPRRQLNFGLEYTF